jgi:hypothetical protein
MSKAEIQTDKTVEKTIYIRGKVREYLDQFGQHYIQNFEFFSDEDRDHVVSIGASIMCTRLDIGFPGGSFVQSVVDNNLSRTFANADSVNAQCIRFYVMMMYNLNLEGLYSI